MLCKYLYGWRRRLGVITLVIACVVMAGWTISLTREAAIVFSLFGRGQCLDSMSGKIHWWAWLDSKSPQPSQWESRIVPVEVPSERRTVDELYWSLQRSLELCPIAESHFFSAELFSHLLFDDNDELQFNDDRSVADSLKKWSVPYWSIVLPLSLLSAGLLFSKPRQAHFVVDN